MLDRLRKALPQDPRDYQIAALTSLLIYGLGFLSFDIEPRRALVIITSALVTQFFAGRLAGLEKFEPRSALISALSLCLLLRTRSLELAFVIAVVTIASKFLIRRRGKHIFNPTNFGLVFGLLLFDGVWISSGQWGSTTLALFFFAGLGSLVIYRAERSDITYAFLFSYAALLCGRALWLGDPWQIPFHQLQSGAFLLFAFFMISDPRTTPESRSGRLLFAALVAVGAYCVQFKLFMPNGLIWSLVTLSCLVPVIDVLLPGRPYSWRPHQPPQLPENADLCRA
jgi:enediyne biosynthesis protein E5